MHRALWCNMFYLWIRFWCGLRRRCRWVYTRPPHSPPAEICKQHEVDPMKGLRPVCPNCHAVLHRRIPAYSIEDVTGFLRRIAIGSAIIKLFAE